MIIKYANYDDGDDGNLLPDMVNDLILTLVENKWTDLYIYTVNFKDTCIKYCDDNELYFEEDYLKYVTPSDIVYLEYMCINKIRLLLQDDTDVSNEVEVEVDDGEIFNEEVDYKQWTGNRIIF